MNTPSISTAASQAFGPPCAQRRIKLAPARAAASVHFVTRADENRTRDGRRTHRLGRRYAAAWVWTHHPSQGRAEKPEFSRVNTCPVNELPPSGLRGAAFVFIRQLVYSLWVTPFVVSASRIARRVVACLWETSHVPQSPGSLLMNTRPSKPSLAGNESARGRGSSLPPPVPDGPSKKTVVTPKSRRFAPSSSTCSSPSSEGEALSAEDVQKLIDRADHDKVRKARARLAASQEESPS